MLGDTFLEVLGRWSCGLEDHWPEPGGSVLWWVPWTYPGLPLSVTLPSFCFHTFLSHPALVPRSLTAILWSLSCFQHILDNWDIKISFPFLQSMLTRLSRTLLLNTRQCTKNWRKPWPRFSSLLLTSSPATNYLRYVGGRGWAVWLCSIEINGRKSKRHSLTSLPFLCAFRDSHHLLKRGKELVLWDQLCCLYLCYQNCKI